MDTKYIEVEVRGILTPESLGSLSKRLSQRGKFLGDYTRFLIDYSTTLTTTLDEIKNRKQDVRLRITNDQPELIVKMGDFAGNGREEVSVMLQPDQFAKAARLMFLLGYREGLLGIRKMKKYDYRGVEITIVEVAKIDNDLNIHDGESFFYEADLTVKEGEVKEAEQRVASAVKELDLDVFSEYAKISKLKEAGVKISTESFYSFVEMLNKTANIITNVEKVDLSKLILNLSIK